MAALMPTYVPQRQRLPPTPISICSAVGVGCFSSSAVQAMTKPGVQNPHCCASLSQNACWTGWSLPFCSSPSTVRIFLPCASMASVVQEYTGLPSTIIVQAPQVARSQTRLAPVMSRSLRNASSSVTRGSTLTCLGAPLMLSVMFTLSGPMIGTSAPAAFTSFSPPVTSGMVRAGLVPLRKFRRDTPLLSGLSLRSSELLISLPPLGWLSDFGDSQKRRITHQQRRRDRNLFGYCYFLEDVQTKYSQGGR